MNFLEFIKKPLTRQTLLSSVREAVSQNELALSQMQKDQWNDGENKQGKIIGRYSKTSEEYAREFGANEPKIAGEPYNLDWTGDLKRGIGISSKELPDDVIITIDSSSSNKIKLFQTIKAYGLIDDPKSIFGYQPKRLDAVTRLINRDSLKNLKRKLNV